MKRTKIFTALGGVRGRQPIDLEALARLLVRFSDLVMEQMWIQEIDINPLLVSARRLLVLDARVVLHQKDTLAPPRPAIRPYPVQYIWPWRLEDRTDVIIRPIRPEDEPLIARLHAKVSERSAYQRYFHFFAMNRRIAHERLVKVCFGDYDRQIALVVERPGSEVQIIAVGRLSKARFMNEAELALLIVDERQGQGVGTELMRRLLEIAGAERLGQITLDLLEDNREMMELCRQAGFHLSAPASGVIHGTLALAGLKNESKD